MTCLLVGVIVWRDWVYTRQWKRVEERQSDRNGTMSVERDDNNDKLFWSVVFIVIVGIGWETTTKCICVWPCLSMHTVRRKRNMRRVREDWIHFFLSSVNEKKLSGNILTDECLCVEILRRTFHPLNRLFFLSCRSID